MEECTPAHPQPALIQPKSIYLEMVLPTVGWAPRPHINHQPRKPLIDKATGQSDLGISLTEVLSSQVTLDSVKLAKTNQPR